VKGDICRPTKGLLAEGACGGTGGGAGAKNGVLLLKGIGVCLCFVCLCFEDQI
jgi:hypothetical protein